MINTRVLTRGIAGPNALTKALDELGIQNGEEFALIRWSPKLLPMSEDELVERLKRDFNAEELPREAA